MEAVLMVSKIGLSPEPMETTWRALTEIERQAKF